MTHKLFINLTVDIDPDNFDASIFGNDRSFSWKGVDENLSLLANELKKHNNVNITWFVRCDEELNKEYNTYVYLFNKYKTYWDKFSDEGDEIAWHPHVDNITELTESYKALVDVKYPITSVRIGNAYQSNSFINALNRYGFLVDSSALPGRKRDDAERKFDWENTPQMPYHPSIEDYSAPGKNNLEILEVPLTMIETKTHYDKKSVKRYLNLTYKHEVIKHSLAQAVKDKNLLVTIIHPSELLRTNINHPLLSFNMRTVIKNIKFIIDNAKNNNKEIKWVTTSYIKKLKQGGEI